MDFIKSAPRRVATRYFFSSAAHGFSTVFPLSSEVGAIQTMGNVPQPVAGLTSPGGLCSRWPSRTQGFWARCRHTKELAPHRAFCFKSPRKFAITPAGLPRICPVLLQSTLRFLSSRVSRFFSRGDSVPFGHVSVVDFHTEVRLQRRQRITSPLGLTGVCLRPCRHAPRRQNSSCELGHHADPALPRSRSAQLGINYFWH